MTTVRVRGAGWNRRQVLILSGTGLAVAALPGCDTLVLDPADEPQADDALSPITANEDFYLTSIRGTWQVEAADWTLSLRNQGVEVGTLDLPWLEALGTLDKEHTLQCIGSSTHLQAIGNAVWGGRPLKDLLDRLGVVPDAAAVEIRFDCADGYTTSVPLSDLDHPLWLVWRMNGVALPAAHGYPARLLTPGRYGTKNPKWVTAIDFVREPWLGTWETSGWSNTAEYLPNTFVVLPAAVVTMEPGPLTLLGTAFSGEDPVVRVEVTDDGGASWTPAELTYAPGAAVWTLWRYTFTPPGAGEYRLQVRMTAASGAVSAPGSGATDTTQGYDGSMAIQVTVA